MHSESEDILAQNLNARLATSGLRLTAQRQHVYQVLLQRRDHPTAEEVFLRVKPDAPDISIATVYNCLDALVKCGLVRQVNLGRGASRFCPNMQEHGHFYCDSCGGMFDIALAGSEHDFNVQLPTGFKVHHFEVAFRGLCPNCQPGSAA